MYTNILNAYQARDILKELNKVDAANQVQMFIDELLKQDDFTEKEVKEFLGVQIFNDVKTFNAYKKLEVLPFNNNTQFEYIDAGSNFMTGMVIICDEGSGMLYVILEHDEAFVEENI